MRIATSTIYDQQVVSVDNLLATYQNVGQQLSTGKRLNAPGDDPSVIAQDLTLAGTMATENSGVSNAGSAQNQLNFVDSTLNGLTNVLQQARSITISSSTDIIPNGVQRQDQAKQIEGLLEQALGLANAQYGTTYIFAGAGADSSPPVTPQGSPPSGIQFTGNLDHQTVVVNGESFRVTTTLQEAFNYKSADGTPDVFALLASIRDNMNTGAVVDQNGQPVNVPGNYITTATKLNALTTAVGPSLAQVPLQPDSNGNVSIAINGVDPVSGNATSQQFTFNPAVDTVGTVINAINAVPTLGVTASWNVQQQRFVLTSKANNGQSPFTIQDVSSAGASNTANFLGTFSIQGQADTINTLSTQLGDIDRVLNNVLKARADVGQRIQSLSSQSTIVGSQVTQNTVVQSGYEDTNVAAATSKFTLTQTALQAAYAVTSRLEGKTLLDYLPA